MEKYTKKLRKRKGRGTGKKKGRRKEITERQIITQIDIKFSENFRDIFNF